MKNIGVLFLLLGVIISCSNRKTKLDKKGFQVSVLNTDDNEKIYGLNTDTLNFKTRPRSVLLTKNIAHSLIPIYKVNYHKKTKKPFTGSTYNYRSWYGDESEGNNWHNNFMPGFEAVYGYNLVNISHHNKVLHKENTLFERPVLIKTLYYPSYSKDTLNFKPISRNHYMVSVYDEDSNKDGYINVNDLRRFYGFDINGENRIHLVPKNYSVMNSEYDLLNDHMYVFARKDENKNGQMEDDEQIHVFWIDLKDYKNIGVSYQNE